MEKLSFEPELYDAVIEAHWVSISDAFRVSFKDI